MTRVSHNITGGFVYFHRFFFFKLDVHLMYYREHGTKTHSQVLEASEISSYIELQEDGGGR